ncbi:O-antigen ligase family protein [Rubrivivax sp. JA1024]|nr:O-antigen ligase family protein [Rubrivivax sp. JA1024]
MDFTSSRDLSLALIVAAAGTFVAVATALTFEWARDGSSSIFYLSYLTVFLSFGFGLWRPFAATLCAFIVIGINPGYPIPHSITSAPSDYLIVGATISLFIRSGGRISFALVTMVVLVPLLLAPTVSLAVAVASPDLQFGKLQIAEYIGMLNMACYVIAPAVLMRDVRDVESLFVACGLGIIPLLAGALAGWPDTVFCYTDGLTQLFTTAGYRVNGLLGDPNIMAVTISSLVPVAITAAMRLGAVWPFMASSVGAVSIVLSGSRSGVASGCLAALLSMLTARQPRARVVMASLSALVIIIFGSSYIWREMPCLLGGPKDRVLFEERNSQADYLKRIYGPDIEASSDRPLSMAEKDKLRDQLIQRLTAAQPLEIQGFKKFGAFSELLAKVPMDDARRLLWGHAAAVGLEHPVFGIGIANLSRVTPRNWRSHNTVLTTFAEQGVVGIVLLACVVVAAMFAAINGFRCAPSPNIRQAYVAVMIGFLACLMGSLSQDMIRQPILWGLLGFLSTGNVFRKTVRENSR